MMKHPQSRLIGALLAVLGVLLGVLFAVPELRSRLMALAEFDGVSVEDIDLDAPIGGPFTLIDENGRTVRDRDFRGRYMLLFFGYTSCPDVCPLTLLNVTRGLEMFSRDDPVRAALVQPIFVTVDPERDTPAVLKAFHQNFSPRIVMLTGGKHAIARLAAQYGVEFRKVEDPRVAGYLMEHTAFLFLMDREGRYVAHLPSDAQPGLIRLTLDNRICRQTERGHLDESCLAAARALAEKQAPRAHE